jgi:hypothetical protein
MHKNPGMRGMQKRDGKKKIADRPNLPYPTRKTGRRKKA